MCPSDLRHILWNEGEIDRTYFSAVLAFEAASRP